MKELTHLEVTQISAGYDIGDLGYDIGYTGAYVLGGGAGRDLGFWLYYITH